MKYWISGTGGHNLGTPLPSIILYDTESSAPILWEDFAARPTWMDMDGD